MATQSQAGTTPLITDIQQVRQIRQFEDKPVPDDLVHTLLEVARWSGSSRNSQPWQFVVITDKEELRKISEIRPPINWVARAPLAIAIVLDGENPGSEPFDEGRVTERLLIAARALGLGAGTAWFGDDAQEQRAKEVLGIPAERAAHSVVAIGYGTSAKDPRGARNNPGRKPLSDLVSYNRFGNRTPSS
ncbi:MAG TPA: nitroreductase family protein [Thermomicrobiales bacterium]|nr:nitroreductase family protein [Thermomicrobiales bacterium]